MRCHWVLTAREWVVLLPLWRRVIKDRRWRVAAAVGTAFAWLIVIGIIGAMQRVNARVGSQGAAHTEIGGRANLTPYGIRL